MDIDTGPKEAHDKPPSSGLKSQTRKKASGTMESMQESDFDEKEDLSEYLRVFRHGKDVAKQIPDGVTTVLLGESTHGTEEYYRIRAEISKYLIEYKGYKLILCEADWTFMWHVNQYIHRKKSNMFPTNIRFPKWMWKNQPFYELIEWMRKRASIDGPYIFGLDCYCKEESKEEVIRFFNFHDRDGLGKVFRQTCYPVEKPDMWPTVLSKLQWEIQEDDKLVRGKNRKGVLLGSKKFRGCSKLDQYNAEQNLECMIMADEYYTRQRLEPPGSRASWNARDQHMMTTMLRLKTHSEQLFGIEEDKLKMIAWAHNSHVGDCTATPSGGQIWEHNEKWNLGQMCRNTLKDVFIVGFDTYHGQVRAAKKWGTPGLVMTLKDALPYSFASQMHRWFPRTPGVCVSLHKLRDFKSFKYTVGSYAIGAEYRAVHTEVYVTPEKQTSQKVDDKNRIKLDISKSFFGVRREWVGTGKNTLRMQIRGYGGDTKYDGWWITEYRNGSSISANCLPVSYLDSLAVPNPNLKILKSITNFGILQRLVGVRYCPNTEVRSHYSEVILTKCYDLSVFVDRTNALEVDLAVPLTLQEHLENESKEDEAKIANDASGRHRQKGAPAPTISKKLNRRLLMEYKKIMKEPIEFIEAQPLDTNILEWHFVITGNDDPYLNGKYHGILEFPDNFPMKPPSIKMLTPSGRFEINKRICLSMSDFHTESWNPSWTVEKILIGLMSFMYEDSRESIGSILDTTQNRRRYAAASPFFNAQNEIYVQLFMTPDEEEEKENIMNLLRSAGGNDGSEKSCRYCMASVGELVAPCHCKGSSAWVHIGCLRQWQKSVVLTQSTHPVYQTKINEICNICNKPFLDQFKPPARHKSILEYTGSDIPKLIVCGNFIVSTRMKSEVNADLFEKYKNRPNLRAGALHFTKSVYFIALADSYNSNKRGGGAVIAVNLMRQIKEPLEKTIRRFPGSYDSVLYPRRAWNSEYLPRLKPILHLFKNVEHFLGGPVAASKAFVLTELPDILSKPMGGFRLKNNLYFGEFLPMLERLSGAVNRICGISRDSAKSELQNIIGKQGLVLKIFWGYGSWNLTQLLGEIARRSCGLVISHAKLAFANWVENTSWENVVDLSVIAKKTEFARY